MGEKNKKKKEETAIGSGCPECLHFAYEPKEKEVNKKQTKPNK